MALALTSVAAIAAGDYHSLALTTSGDVYVWGRNNTGQIGNGTTTNVTAPWLVATGAQAIAAGGTHTLVVKADGTVWGTGANGNGQLSDGTTSQRLSLVQAAGLTTVVAASGGSKHSVFLLADGTVLAAGYNVSGEVGDGTTTQRTTAVPVAGLSGIVAIDAGANHTLAAAADGTLWAWGDNTYGGLGDGANTDRTTPVTVATVGDVAACSAGQGFSLAVTPLGYVWVAGRNNSSQLGDGATTDLSAPVSISNADFAWRVATPTFNDASGTYTSDRTVTVSVVTPGATIHYTQNGAEPTEADPVVASGGSVVVSQSQTLKARAWKAGMPAGNTAVATYTMQVATPSVSPSAGTYTSARTVTLSTSTPGATIRYTVDGTDPTPASPAYASALTIATTTTLKAVGVQGELVRLGRALGDVHDELRHADGADDHAGGRHVHGAGDGDAGGAAVRRHPLHGEWRDPDDRLAALYGPLPRGRQRDRARQGLPSRLHGQRREHAGLQRNRERAGAESPVRELRPGHRSDGHEPGPRRDAALDARRHGPDGEQSGHPRDADLDRGLHDQGAYLPHRRR